jgi:hypothetical protein
MVPIQLSEQTPPTYVTLVFIQPIALEEQTSSTSSEDKQVSRYFGGHINTRNTV